MTTTVVSPPQQQEELVSALPTSRVSPKTVDGGVNALLKWRSEKSKTEKPQLLEQDEFVYLIVTLKKIPQASRTNAYRIRLPHPLIDPAEDSPELCLIIDDRPKSGLTKEDAMKKIKSENIPITKVIKLSKLKANYRAYEAKRKLCDSYDMFFADRRVIPLLPRLIGKKFFATKKLPVPLDLKHKNWKEQMEKACGSAMFFMRTGTCCVIKVGKLSMESNEIAENVMETLNGVVEILPNKWKYVRSLHLKLSESLALPIYQTVPDLKLKIDGFESEKSVVVREEKKVGESDDVVVAVDGGESSEKSVSVKGKKKKGRIHEVRYMDSNVTEVLDEDEIGDVEVSKEIVVESGDSEKKMRKRKKAVTEVAESEKPMKKAAKGKLKEKSKVAALKPKEKSKAAALKPEEKTKVAAVKPKKTKVTKEESGGGLKQKRTKKSVLKN
uniref:Putative ribosome biogenesis protein C8F11.04 n=1 Tax=Noccaea caerulescens TaxID=107243 RepID=A0A1J3CY65_NOCCA